MVTSVFTEASGDDRVKHTHTIHVLMYGIFTYMKTIKSSIHVGKYTINMDPIWDIVDVRRGRVGIITMVMKCYEQLTKLTKWDDPSVDLGEL